MIVELLRVEFRIIGLERDEHGLVSGERTVADGVVYAAALDELPQAVRGAVSAAGGADEGDARAVTPAPSPSSA